MRRMLALSLIALAASPALAAPGKHAARAHRAPARRARAGHPRHVRLGLVPHKKGVSNLFYMTQPIEGERQDPSMDGTAHKSIPLD